MDEIVGMLIGVLVIQTGRLFLRMASFGRWKCDGMGSNAHRIHGAAGSLSYWHEGQRVITRSGQMLAGTLLYASPLLLLLLFHLAG